MYVGAFVVEKEEQLIAPDGAAEIASELVPAQRRFGVAGLIGEEIVRIEFVVAEVLEQRAVKLVRTGLGGDIENATAGGSVLRGEGTTGRAELLDSLDADGIDEDAAATGQPS